METLRMRSDSEFFDSYNDTTVRDIREVMHDMASVYFEAIGRDKGTFDALEDIAEKYARDFTVAILEDESFEPSGLACMVASLNLALSMFFTVVGTLEGAEIAFDAAVMGGEIDEH